MAQTKPAAAYRKFNDLPMEIHGLIYKGLFNEECTKPCSCWGNFCDPRSSTFQKEFTPLSLLNPAWRALVQQSLFSKIVLRAEELDAFIRTIKANPTLLSFIKELEITHAAIDSVDRPATEGTYNEEAAEAAQRGGMLYYSEHDPVLKLNPPTVEDRCNALLKTWNDIGELVAIANNSGIHLKLSKLTLKADDHTAGSSDGIELSGFSLLPPPADMTKYELLPIPNLFLKKLLLSCEVVKHLEINQEVVKSILRAQPTIKSLQLRTSDIRYYRKFRREIYDGLVDTVRLLGKDLVPNLTSFTLYYPSSCGIYQCHWSRCFSPGGYDENSDPLITALRILSYQLVKFSLFGRISKHLFTYMSPSAWPKLETFFVESEAVDSLGFLVLVGSDLYDPYNEGICCSRCRSCQGIRNHECLPRDPWVERISAQEADYRNEEGVDLMMCDECKAWTLEDSLDIYADRVDEIFHQASLAMLQMPSIKSWTFRIVSEHLSFSFYRKFNENFVFMEGGHLWQPTEKAKEIWKERFPDLVLHSI